MHWYANESMCLDAYIQAHKSIRMNIIETVNNKIVDVRPKFWK